MNIMSDIFYKITYTRDIKGFCYTINYIKYIRFCCKVECHFALILCKQNVECIYLLVLDHGFCIHKMYVYKCEKYMPDMAVYMNIYLIYI